jgi:amino acid adenylation domain-containing protein
MDAARGAAVKPEQIADIYELSPVQQGMLFHALYDPEAGVYCRQLSCALCGSLDPAVLERAWQQVVERHSILRTSFHWEDLEKPLQVVHRSAHLRLEQHDWRLIDPAEQEARLDSYLREEQTWGFDLSQAPLMRLVLIRRSEDAYQFIWSHHQLLLDGWSGSLLLQEVSSRYEALCHGEELPWQQSWPYGDYIEWLQQQDLSGAEAFWREALQGFNTPTPLVAGRAVGSLRGQKETYGDQGLRLSRTTTAALQTLARQHQLTLNTLVQGAWALLLGRYSGEDDVLFGVTSAGRPASLAGVESMVGLFINSLPLRVRLRPEAPLLPWLKALQAQQFEMREYEHCPLVEIQGWSEVPRGAPLFESILVFQNYPVGRSSGMWGQQSEAKRQGLKIQDVRSTERTIYPLTVIVVPGPELSLLVSYDSYRFDPPAIRRMLGHLQTLLEGMAADPLQRLSCLPLLTAAERQQLLVEWNQTHPRSGYPASGTLDQCIHALFEAQVERTPDAAAVVFEDERLTYRELNQRANQLAHHLRSLGVGPEVLVGLCVDRSPQMVVGLLGILKAGGAYLPLDLAFPRERLGFVLADAQVPVLVTEQQCVDPASVPAARVVYLDVDSERIARCSGENPHSAVQPHHLAYVIYTSGSTGCPKGVEVPHRAVANLLASMREAPGLTPEDTLLAVTTISFDIAALEMFLPLGVGARLVILDREETTDPALLMQAIQRHGGTVMQATPATWRSLLDAGWAGEPRLKIFCGGEALSRELADRLLKHSASLWNMYGPTETTIYSCIHRVESEEGLVPIGKPIAYTQFYVLDQHLQPVPMGIPGELHIGGAGLARGYLNQPELTAEKFIPHPFDDTPEARLYKTGDRVRYLADGNLEFLGRWDQQVKIRGFRIELGEIEAVLMQHPAVRENVVLAREDHPGGRRLVAYVVLSDQGKVTSNERGKDPNSSLVTGHWSLLREFLKEKLPEYMVPAAIVVLETLPLTPSGKIDRRSLPEPDPARPELAEPFVAPASPVEERLAAIWAEVLGVEKVGIHDDFFELGGHSLLATQVVARARRLCLSRSSRSIVRANSCSPLPSSGSGSSISSSRALPPTTFRLPSASTDLSTW